MITFYVFRHAETFFSKNNVPYGDEILLAPILKEGIPKVEHMASSLTAIKCDLAVTSPIKRCLDTAKIVGKITNISFVPDVRLEEWMEPEEKFEELVTRLEDFLADMKKSDHKIVFICTHGACIAGLKHLIEDGSFEESDIHDYPTPGVVLTLQLR